MCNIPCQF